MQPEVVIVYTNQIVNKLLYHKFTTFLHIIVLFISVSWKIYPYVLYKLYIVPQVDHAV